MALWKTRQQKCLGQMLNGFHKGSDKKNWTGVDRNGNCDRPRGDHHSSDAGQQFRIYADLADHTDCFYGNYIYDGDKPAGDRDGNADHSCNP